MRLETRILHDPSFHAAVEQRVGAAEAKTDAEVVVALAPGAGLGRPSAGIGGAVLAALALALVIYDPKLQVPHRDVVPVVLFAYLLGQLLGGRVPRIARALAGRRWTARAVAEAADRAFFEEHVDATKERCGVLVFVSVRERAVRIVADTGIAARVTPERWDTLLRDQAPRLGASFPEGVLAVIDAVGDVLAGAAPKTAGDENELPNAPRVLS